MPGIHRDASGIGTNAADGPQDAIARVEGLVIARIDDPTGQLQAQNGRKLEWNAVSHQPIADFPVERVGGGRGDVDQDLPWSQDRIGNFVDPNGVGFVIAVAVQTKRLVVHGFGSLAFAYRPFQASSSRKEAVAASISPRIRLALA